MAKQRLVQIQQSADQLNQEHSKVRAENASIESERQTLTHQYDKSFEANALIDAKIIISKKRLTDANNKSLALSKTVEEVQSVKELMQVFLADYSKYEEPVVISVMGEDMAANTAQLQADFSTIEQQYN